MSLSPSEVYLGPENIPQVRHFDSYYYFGDRFIADEIAKGIQVHYTFERVAYPEGNGIPVDLWSNHGTRVQTLEHEVYGRFIAITTISTNGEYTYFDGVDYYLRWRTDRP